MPDQKMFKKKLLHASVDDIIYFEKGVNHNDVINIRSTVLFLKIFNFHLIKKASLPFSP